MTDATNGDVVVERLVAASPQDVFAMLSEPERLRRWQALSATVDLRVGGDYSYTVTPGNIAEGTFVEIEPGRRLVYTWGWAGQDVPETGASTITVDLEPKDGQTWVRMTHSGLPSEQQAGHAEGWEHYADRLVVAANGDAGADTWHAEPDPLDPLSAAEATWAICQLALRRLSKDDAKTASTCEGLDLHGLVEHLLGSMRGLGGMAGAEIPEEIEATSAEDYIAQAVAPTLSAWRARGVDGEVPFGDGMAPAAVPAGILSLEFLVHAWDFATSVGQTIEVSDEVASYVLGVAQMIIQPDNRGEGKGFAAEVPVDDDNPMAQLIGFTGRAV